VRWVTDHLMGEIPWVVGFALSLPRLVSDDQAKRKLDRFDARHFFFGRSSGLRTARPLRLRTRAGPPWKDWVGRYRRERLTPWITRSGDDTATPLRL
jgi:hypothetical protein